MYTDQGVNACDTGVTRPGSLNHEKQDAAQLAGWNVAYMKVWLHRSHLAISTDDFQG